MSPIKSVRIFNSPINFKDGVDIGPGFAVIPDHMPENEADIIQIGDDIRTAVMAFNRK